MPDNKRAIEQFSRYLKDRYDFGNLEKIFYYVYHKPQNETEVFFQMTQTQFHLGEIGKNELYAHLISKLKFTDDFSFDTFCQLWPVRWKRIEGTIAILKELKKYKRYLLSDTNELDAEYLEKHHSDIFSEFDHVFFSHITRVNKHNQKAWQNVINHSKMEPYSHIFIDDRIDYVKKAEDLGMKGIVYKDPADLRRQLITCGCEMVSST